MTLCVWEQQDWDPSVREGEPGARDDCHTGGHHPTASKHSRQTRAGDGNGFAIKQKQRDKPSPKSRTWSGPDPPTTQLRPGAGAPAQREQVRLVNAPRALALCL